MQSQGEEAVQSSQDVQNEGMIQTATEVQSVETQPRQQRLMPGQIRSQRVNQSMQ